ncbi:MAG: hypothetical protein U0271_40605 [Polyangiaceae bacterium]
MSLRQQVVFGVALALGLGTSVLACGDDSVTGGGGAGGASSGGAPSGGADSGGAGGGDPAEVQSAIDACYETLHGAVDGRQAALDALKTAATDYPDNARVHLFLGMCSLAALAEDNNLAALADIEPALTRAMELAPDDLRIPGWLATVRVQTARILGDQAAVDAAVAEMIDAADLYPEFNNVSLAIAFAGFPIETGYPDMAVARLEAIVDCGNTDPRCRDNPAAPHNIPGSLMLFGDVYARVGNTAKAGEYYQAALAAESAPNWPYSTDANAMSTGLADRAAAWTDADPMNDPEFFLSGARTCRGCHE